MTYDSFELYIFFILDDASMMLAYLEGHTFWSEDGDERPLLRYSICTK